MNEKYKEDVEEAIIENYPLNELANDLYTREDNYNNADKNTKQTVLTKDEIYSELENIQEELKEDSEHCSFCGMKYIDEDYVTNFESRGEYWGAPCDEEVVIGYICSNCGEEESF